MALLPIDVGLPGSPSGRSVVFTRGAPAHLTRPVGRELLQTALLEVADETPERDQVTALRELARVLKSSGRLVVGELFGDPHRVSPKRLRARAHAAGLAWTRRSGTPLGYFALFHRDPAS